MVRLSGTEAPSVTRRHTCWLPDASGELKKHWRIGPNKAYPAFRLEGKIKYLGIIISYANHEMLTLRHRLAEAGKKIQQVRRYIYNRRIASPAEYGLLPSGPRPSQDCQRSDFHLNQLGISEAGMLTCLTSRPMSLTLRLLTSSNFTSCRTQWTRSFGA